MLPPTRKNSSLAFPAYVLGFNFAWSRGLVFEDLAVRQGGRLTYAKLSAGFKPLELYVRTDMVRDTETARPAQPQIIQLGPGTLVMQCDPHFLLNDGSKMRQRRLACVAANGSSVGIASNDARNHH
jgi:hypothetical protein